MAQTTGNSLDTSPLHTFLNHLQFTLAMRRHFEHTHLSQQNKKKKKKKETEQKKYRISLQTIYIFISFKTHPRYGRAPGTYQVDYLHKNQPSCFPIYLKSSFSIKEPLPPTKVPCNKHSNYPNIFHPNHS